MATNIKITRPNRLTENETLTSFQDWRNNLTFYLSQDKDLKEFLKAETRWVKTSSGSQHRGLESAEELQHLQHFLGVVAGLSPLLLYNDIINDTTKISDILKLLCSYYCSHPKRSIKFVSYLE